METTGHGCALLAMLTPKTAFQGRDARFCGICT